LGVLDARRGAVLRFLGAPRNAALGIRRKRNMQKELLSKTTRRNGGSKTRTRKLR
jgi:hypothetical protein